MRESEKPLSKPPVWPERMERFRTKAVLDFMLRAFGSARQYELDISRDELARKLYDRFGEGPVDEASNAYLKLMQYPSLIRNKTLRALAEQKEKDGGFDESQVHHELGTVDPAILPLREKAARLSAAPREERPRLIAELRDGLSRYLKARNVREGSGDRSRQVTVEEVEEGTEGMLWASSGCSVDLREIVEPLKEALFETALETRIGSLDRKALARETKKWGAKGANLDVLSKLEQAFAEFDHMLEFKVPPYMKVPAARYSEWKKGEKILSEAARIHKWAEGRKIIIRSSAVYSEDADAATGAGIYESVVLEANATLRDIYEAMTRIYKSVESENALAYRKSLGIPRERMGLVVQEYVDATYGERSTVNTVVKNVPELLEITYGDGVRPIFNKDALMKMTQGTGIGSAYHYELDIRRKSSAYIQPLAQLALLLEKYYGQPLQLEVVESTREDFDITQFNLVQARFLPKHFSEKLNIEFPPEEPLFTGRAVGVFDITLPVLSNMRDNTKKKGAVVFNSGKYFSQAHLYGSESALPREGGVVVLQPSKEMFGHIETICAERNMALVFSDDFPDPTSSFSELQKIRLGIMEGAQIENSHLDGYRTLRLMSDGLQGRVYGVGEKDPDAEEPEIIRRGWGSYIDRGSGL